MRDDDCKVVMPLKGLMSAWMTPRVDDSPRLCRKSPTHPPLAGHVHSLYAPTPPKITRAPEIRAKLYTNIWEVLQDGR